jgi:choline dehydrogenase-like flavoprotein
VTTYDAVIVGSGACGGWAALELTRKGLKTLVLEAGGPIDPAKDYVEHVQPYEVPFRVWGDRRPLKKERPIQTDCYACDEIGHKFFVNDVENPYTTSPDTNYRWTRSRCLGGRTLHWARATDRMADYEFKAASRDGYGMDWAVSYADMKPYYDRIESLVGVSGAAEGLPQFPDGVFLPVMPLNCAETIFTAACKGLGWPSTHRRLSQLTRPHNGRPPCHYCGNCVNGCDVGAMFNPIAVTLPPELATGRLEIRNDRVDARADEHGARAQGVTYIERFTKRPWTSMPRG